MTFERLHISVFLGLAVVAWGIVLYLQGVRLSADELWQHLAPFSTVVGVMVGAGALLEKVAWRWPWLHGWFVKRPDLRGTWRCELKSDWVNPETGEGVPPIACFMGVTQTLSTLQMHLMTPESESWFIADQIRPSPNGAGYQVIGVYSNKPDVHLRSVRSERHEGALALDAHGAANRPASLTGEYWTDRKTTGSMVLDDRVDELFTRYDDAKAAFASSAE